MNEGKIIAITGGPRSGKSTLVKLLSQRLGATPFLEGEEKDFPTRIIDDIAQGDNQLELVLYFRNLLIKQYAEALRIKQEGKIAVLDCFWLTNQVYIDAWVPDEFQRSLLTELTNLDMQTYPWPDAVLVLTQSDEGIREFIQLGGREFENNAEYFERQLAIHRQHDRFFKEMEQRHPNVVFFDRTGLDFMGKEEDLERVLRILPL
ncbi:MAG: AAA family ATPase [Patescibacteria group bacterium]